jgi:hypothetical protein
MNCKNRCRSYGADRMFQARYYKDFAPTERAWPLQMSKLQQEAQAPVGV